MKSHLSSEDEGRPEKNIFRNCWWGSEVSKIHPNLPWRTNEALKPEEKIRYWSGREGFCLWQTKGWKLRQEKSHQVRRNTLPVQAKWLWKLGSLADPENILESWWRKNMEQQDILKSHQGLQLHRHILFSLSSSLRTGRQRFCIKFYNSPKFSTAVRGKVLLTSPKDQRASLTPKWAPNSELLVPSTHHSVWNMIWFCFPVVTLALKKKNLLQELSLKKINLKTVKIYLFSIFQNWSQPFPCQDKRHFYRSSINLWLVLDDLHMQPK